MITTPYGMHVRYISHLDENRQLATVIGFQKQVMQYPLSQLKADGGIDEMRQNHANYLNERPPAALDLEPKSIARGGGI